MNKQRSILLDVAQRALNAVRGDRLVERSALAVSPGPSDIAAIGKAACAMMEGAHKVWGSRIKRSLLITKTGYVTPGIAGHSGIEVLEAGHPVPDAASLAAGQRLLDWVAAADLDAQLLFLISGGASSLVEAPAAGIGLPELQSINRWLLGSGLDIEQINRIRRRISRIKGGGLLREAGNRKISVWLLSDVPGDDPAAIGSGLLYPSQTGELPAVDYPPGLKMIIENTRLGQQDATAYGEQRVVPEHRILGNLRMACEAARDAAAHAGCQAHFHEPELDGDALATGCRLAEQLMEMPNGIHIWGGETTVRLPDNPGRGGRNQHLALAAATRLAGRRDICLLALGTDGSDGPGEDAGALVDGGTVGRGELAGLDAGAALRHADSGGFLEASGDLISTGVTGTNVRDLVIAIRHGSQP